MTTYLSLEDLLAIAGYAVGGEPVVRDAGLLESAAARPRTTVFGEDAYPTVFQKAAALCESLVCNHALVDGNKRLGWLATWVFCDINGVVLQPSQDEVVDLIVTVAEGTMRDIPALAAQLESWQR
ncbi:type II toxin-antitoxin system death-on-curing family toxin [Pseudonocardia phyllosphaerae]|uniref:type II toxin-antitoxin system death-on-curing family toxin n=1 Tax=Pseudonocardia phyllosphaerae TaxID=3390502 RepID=UPI003979D4E5